MFLAQEYLLEKAQAPWKEQIQFAATCNWELKLTARSWRPPRFPSASRPSKAPSVNSEQDSRRTIPKTAFVRRAYREVSCALQRGNGMMYARSLFNVARALDRQFMPGLDTPVQEEGLV